VALCDLEVGSGDSPAEVADPVALERHVFAYSLAGHRLRVTRRLCRLLDLRWCSDLSLHLSRETILTGDRRLDMLVDEASVVEALGHLLR
jgi:hypothetical protein